MIFSRPLRPSAVRVESLAEKWSGLSEIPAMETTQRNRSGQRTAAIIAE
jgi:hypothetical protein